MDKISSTHVTIAMGVLCAVVIAVCTASAYTSSGPLPAPGPPPAATPTTKMAGYRYRPAFYASLVADDAKKVGLGKVSVKSLLVGNAYRAEFKGRQLLKPKGALETDTLLLKGLQSKLWIGNEGQQFRATHFVLRITNRSDKHIAYRVETEAEGPCGQKAVLGHNAITLRPQQSVERTECTLGKATRIIVRSVEVLELTPLGFHYVQRIEPRALLFPVRTAEGHDPGKLSSCRIMPWQLLKDALPTDALRWYDVVDFYSRHNCDEYTFFEGYRWSPKGPGELPTVPPSER